MVVWSRSGSADPVGRVHSPLINTQPQPGSFPTFPTFHSKSKIQAGSCALLLRQWQDSRQTLVLEPGLEVASSLRPENLEKPKAAEPLEELELQSSSHMVPTELWEPQLFHGLKTQGLMWKTPPGVVPWDPSAAAPGTRCPPLPERNTGVGEWKFQTTQIQGNELWMEQNNQLSRGVL